MLTNLSKILFHVSKIFEQMLKYCLRFLYYFNNFSESFENLVCKLKFINEIVKTFRKILKIIQKP